jgi:hypothetical protein
MTAVVEFKNQDWVQDILQASSAPGVIKSYVNPNVAFPFQDNFLAGTIHGTNARPANSTNQQAENTKGNNKGVIKILDNKDEDNVSILTTKIQDKLVALLVQARKQICSATVGSRVASGSNLPPGSSPAATHSQTNAGGQKSTSANSASPGTGSNGVSRDARSGLGGK